MRCEEIQEALSQFIDDEIDHTAMPLMFAHLGECGECQAFLQSAIKVRSAVVAASPIRVPDSLDAKVRRLWEREEIPTLQHRPIFTRFWQQRYPVPAPALGATVLLILSLLISTLTMTFRGHDMQQSTAQREYTLTLPTVEIQGTYPETQKPVQ